MRIKELKRLLSERWARLRSPEGESKLQRLREELSAPRQEIAAVQQAGEAWQKERERAEVALQATEKRCRLLEETSPGVVYAHDLEGVLLSVGSLDCLGYRPGDIVGGPLAELLVPREHDSVEPYLNRVREEGAAFGSAHFRAKGGNERALEYRSLLVEDGGRDPYVLGQAQDVTDARKNAAVLAAQRQVLDLIASGCGLHEIFDALAAEMEHLLPGTTCLILLLDEDDRRLVVGAAPSVPDVYRRAINGLAVGPQAGSAARAVRQGRTVIVENVQNDPQWGEDRQLALSQGLGSSWSVPIRASFGKVVGALTVCDVRAHAPTEEELRILREGAELAGLAIQRLRAEEEIKEVASRDTLTGLPNGPLFRDRLAQALTAVRRQNRSLAVYVLGLDRFRAVNETHGPSIGDELLRRVAKRLERCLRREDTVARLGGDEFLLLLPETRSQAAALRVAQKSLESLHPPFQLVDEEFFLTASLGMAMFPEHGDDVDTLIRNAASSMSQVKEQGGDDFRLYSPGLKGSIVERITLENRLRTALNDEQFVLHYQPAVELEGDAIRTVEALLRWNHPEKGLLHPSEFLCVAETSGLIIAIGIWVLRVACSQLKAWHDKGHDDLTLSVNLSPRQLRHPDLVVQVGEAVAEAEIPPSSLYLEISEPHAMENPEATLGALLSLKELGVQVSIDDFGRGSSSLMDLERFPIDNIKIDRELIRDLCSDHPDREAVVSTAIVLAHSLNLKVIAEGVETKEQREFLSARHCDLILGHLVTPAQPAKQIEKLLRRKRRKATAVPTISA